MKERFADALALFPPGYHFDVIGYGCTSASLLIGEDTVQAIVKSHVDVDHVTTPLTGAKRALKAVGARNIGYLAPYISEISEKMCFLLEDNGFEIGAAATFGEGRDSVVGCIHPQSILDAVDTIISSATIPLDAIFISCTSLKCAPIIAIAEAQYGIPVISSNSALAWDMARLARLAMPANEKSLLFQQD
jgi:maleate isomerase